MMARAYGFIALPPSVEMVHCRCLRHEIWEQGDQCSDAIVAHLASNYPCVLQYSRHKDLPGLEVFSGRAQGGKGAGPEQQRCTAKPLRRRAAKSISYASPRRIRWDGK